MTPAEKAEIVERVAKAIWEVKSPNPPAWAAWEDYSGFGPSKPKRAWTIKQAEAALTACGLFEAVEALDDLLKTAALLEQNSEGCIVQHHGFNIEADGLPGWLRDCDLSIRRASAVLEKVKECGNG